MEHIPTEKTDYKGIRYLRCTKFRDGCSARARLCLQSNEFSIIQEHNDHETAGHRLKLQRFYQNLSEKLKIPNNLYVKFLMKR